MQIQRHAMTWQLEYGNTHLLSCSYIKELRQWEPIKLNDSVEFKRFYRFLLKCQAYKQQHQLQELDSTDMLRVVILKVPQLLQDKWNRKVLDTRRKHKREVDFSDIVKFLETETTLIASPTVAGDTTNSQIERQTSPDSTTSYARRQEVCSQEKQ